jgi:DNA modification methylase
MDQSLVKVEQKEYERCKNIIHDGIRTFQEVGSALLKIRDGKLYREEYKTFEECCQKEWGMVRQQAYQYMQATEVAKNLSTRVDKIQLSEGITRPLARLEPEKQLKAWERAVEIANPKPTDDPIPPTGKQVKEAVRGLSIKVNPEKLNHRTIKLIHGEMEKEIPKLGKFDLIIADPPYNVTDWEWDKIGSEFLPKTKEWLSICKNALADKYHLFWFCSPKYSADIEMLFRELNLPIQSRIVWHRRNMSMGSVIKDKFIDSWEMIFHSGNYPLNLPEEWNDRRFDVQTFAVPQTNFGDMKLHPTQKPLELIKLLVEFGSYSGSHVLDPFAGAGTTAASCEGRDYVLIEKELEYIKIMEKRLNVTH